MQCRGGTGMFQESSACPAELRGSASTLWLLLGATPHEESPDQILLLHEVQLCNNHVFVCFLIFGATINHTTKL